ncbi:MAG: hypothetical protein JSW58_04080 [Candidatus Latescibacterota bacterium]|nr:MAG: hypothetical protein JSW58_04080 [Candidatus Latescibacterota bacterium]
MKLVSIFLLCALSAPGHTEKSIPDSDRVRIAEAFRIADSVGETVWPGLGEAPFTVLLVTPETEFLIGHPYPTADFDSLGYDSFLDGNVYSRKRVFNTNVLASFPAVAGVPTVVIGQPKNTEASHSTRWVMTLLHEHFHQWQQSQPDYYASVDSLGLARGDTTGMWMLEYPFPYDSTTVNDAFSVMCRRLGEVLEGLDSAEFRHRLKAYLETKKQFKKILARDDYAYFSFQVWQEGIARYTEYQVAKMAAAVYEPTEDFRGLADYVPFARVATEIREHVATELMRVSLKKARRSAFYHVGAAEGIVLDRANSGWRRYYFESKFSTDKYFGLPSD